MSVLFSNEQGGGMGTLFISLAVLVLLISIFINIVDYSVYTYKRNALSKAMDYAVSAAVQEVDKEQSRDGLEDGFSEDTGKKILEDINIDIDRAAKTFNSFFNKNCTLNGVSLDERLLICTTSVRNDQIYYTIKSNQTLLSQGTVSESSDIQDKINEAINSRWPGTLSSSRIYINGNPKTNMLENGTYIFAFINNIKVSGVYSERYIDLSSLAGAKVER